MIVHCNAQSLTVPETAVNDGIFHASCKFGQCSATSTDIWSWPRQGSITSEVEITFYMVKKERTYIGLVDVKKLESQ